MHSYGMTQLLIFNAEHFTSFSIATVDPASV